MKTSSKIAIAAAAVGAWLIAKGKKAISGVGNIVRNKKTIEARRDFAYNYLLNGSKKLNPEYVDQFVEEFATGRLKTMANGGVKFGGRRVQSFALNKLVRDIESAWISQFVEFGIWDKDGNLIEGISGIGGVQQLDYDDYVVSTQDGRHAVEFQWMSDGDVSVSAWYKGDGSNPQFNWDFWNHVGFYKTLAGAKRGAKKFMADRGYELKDTDLNKVK